MPAYSFLQPGFLITVWLVTVLHLAINLLAILKQELELRDILIHFKEFSDVHNTVVSRI